jgi:hypothetical protein
VCRCSDRSAVDMARAASVDLWQVMSFVENTGKFARCPRSDCSSFVGGSSRKRSVICRCGCVNGLHVLLALQCVACVRRECCMRCVGTCTLQAHVLLFLPGQHPCTCVVRGAYGLAGALGTAP